MSGLISLTFDGFPNGYCYPGDPNDLAADIVAYTSLTFNAAGNYYYNLGNTVPGVDYRVYPWVKTETDANGPQGIWVWNTTIGAWIKHHPVPNSTYDPYTRIIHTGTLAQVDTKDWGETAVVGDAAGPFWEVDSNFNFRMPLGAGGSPDGTIVVPGDTGGEEFHVLTEAEIPSHVHTGSIGGGPHYGSDGHTSGADAGDNNYELMTTKHPFTLSIDAAGGDDKHQNMPPYIGVYFLKRTARLYYRIN